MDLAPRVARTVANPMTRMRQAEPRLTLWRQVFEASPEGVLITDGALRIVAANQAFCRMFGHDAANLLGRLSSTVLAERPSSRQIDDFWSALRHEGVWRGELMARRGDGCTFPASFAVSAMRDADGQPSHYIFNAMDITERKRNEERAAFLAHHDPLTGLPNRALCLERLGLALRQAERNRDRVAVLFLDLDRFKAINDSLGHHAGDALLCSVAQRLTAALRATDTVSRLGGDEFVVLLAGIGETEEVAEVIERRILPALQAPHDLEGRAVAALGSIGVALFPDDGTQTQALMRRADLAMYAAKLAGRGVVRFYTPELDHAADERQHVQASLREAMQRQDLRLHYQPRIDASSGRLVAVEALLRWSHPVHGAVPTARFIEIAEECGLILPLGTWVVDQVCRQLAAWQGTPMAGVVVSIAVSAVQLGDGGLADALRAALREHRLPPELIELELPESALTKEGASRHLQALRALGVTLAIGQFGTGHTSMGSLARLPVDKLKIDRALCTPLGRQPAARAVVDALVALGHALQLKVVAEGVDRASIANELRAAGCDELQGTIIAKPMLPDRLPAWLGVARPCVDDGMPAA